MTKETENTRATASLNLSMKAMDEERRIALQLEKITKEDFINMAKTGETNKLRALMKTVGHPVANELFTYYSNLLDDELGCEPQYRSAKLIRKLLNLTWNTFKIALTFHHVDAYQTKKVLMLKGMGQEYILDKAQLSYRDYDESKDDDIELD